MINENSLQAVDNAQFGEHFIAPLYESYCFSNIPGTIKRALGAPNNSHLPPDVLGSLPQQYEKVVLLYIDAFGWEAFESAQDEYPFLQRFAAQGVVSKLTSQFPSTTSAHVTTLYSGLPVGESGVYEWFYYEPLLDRVICPLLWSFAGDKERGTLAPTGMRPELLLPPNTLHQDLQRAGARSFIFQHKEYSVSPYSTIASAGAEEVVSFTTLPEAGTLIADAVASVEGKALFFLYFDKVDAIGHDYGPSSVQYAAELDACLIALERQLVQRLAGKVDDTLLLVITDHGQTDVTPDSTVYLNKQVPEIAPLIRPNKTAHLLTPAGSPVDYFLHVREGRVDDVLRILAGRLEGIAEVHKVSGLIEAGFFGPRISQAFRARVGDLVILPHSGNSVWWYEQDRFEMKMRGLHGGLSRAEMEIPFLALAL